MNQYLSHDYESYKLPSRTSGLCSCFELDQAPSTEQPLASIIPKPNLKLIKSVSGMAKKTNIEIEFIIFRNRELSK